MVYLELVSAGRVEGTWGGAVESIGRGDPLGGERIFRRAIDIAFGRHSQLSVAKRRMSRALDWCLGKELLAMGLGRRCRTQDWV